MFGIGDFARRGQVSVRMLRHYDAIGLLPPAFVDPVSGYRYYSAAQLARLNRLVVLKDLGFTLQQVGAILDERVSAEELRGMLRLRQAELAASVAAEAARLAQVEARLRAIESEGCMSAADVVVKPVPAVRVAELRAVAEGHEPEFIGPVVGPLFEELCVRLSAAGVTPVGPGIAYYEPTGDRGAVTVHAAMPVGADVTAKRAFEVVVLPAIEAATLVHQGSMDDVMPSVQALGVWLEEHGYRSTGLPREVYLDVPDDVAAWVTELQEPVVRGI